MKILKILRNEINRVINNRKIQLAQTALDARFKVLKFQIALLQTDNKVIKFDYSNDKILESEIGKYMMKIRRRLKYKKDIIFKNKKRLNYMILKAGHDPYMNKWLESRYKDIIRTIIIFANFFEIKPINKNIVDYVIHHFYLPCQSIYLEECGGEKVIPPEFQRKVELFFEKNNYDIEVLQTLWNFVSCLSYNLIYTLYRLRQTWKRPKNIKKTIKSFKTELTYSKSASDENIKLAIKHISDLFRQYKPDKHIYNYLPSVAEIISGKEYIQDATTDQSEEILEWLKNNAPRNRINFFI